MQRLFVLEGKEQHLIDDFINERTSNMKFRSMNYCSFDHLSEDLYAFIKSVPIIDDEKIAFIRQPIAGKGKDLEQLISCIPSTSKLICSFEKGFDKKYLRPDVSVVNCKKLSNLPALKGFITKEFEKNGRTVSINLIDYICDRSGYLINTDVNLQTLAKSIELICCVENISKNVIDTYVKQSLTSNIFDVFKIIKNDGDVYSYVEQLTAGDKKKAPMLIGLIHRQFRVAAKLKLYPDLSTAAKEIGIHTYYVKQYPTELGHDEIKQAIDSSRKATTRFKSGQCTPEESLYFLIAEIRGLLGRNKE